MVIIFLIGWILLTVFSKCFPSEWIESDKAEPLSIVKVQNTDVTKETTRTQKVMSILYGSASIPLYAQEPLDLGEFSNTLFTVMAPLAGTVSVYQSYKTWQDWNNTKEERNRIPWQSKVKPLLLSTVQAVVPVMLLFHIEQDHKEDEGLKGFTAYDLFFALHAIPLFASHVARSYIHCLTSFSREREFAHRLLSITSMKDLETIESNVQQNGEATLKGLTRNFDLSCYGYLRTWAALSSTALVASYYVSLSDTMFAELPKVAFFLSVGLYTTFSMLTFLEDALSLSMTIKTMMMGLYETWPVIAFMVMNPHYFDKILLPSVLGVGMKMLKSGYEFPPWNLENPIKYNILRKIRFIDDDQEIKDKKRSLFKGFKVKYT